MKSVVRPQKLAFSFLIAGFVLTQSTATLAIPEPSITPKGSIVGSGVSIALSVFANLLTDFLKAALGRNDITNETSLSKVDFDNANIKTAFFLATDADGATKTFTAKSNGDTSVPQTNIVSLGKCKGADRSKAEIGGTIGFWGTSMGIPLVTNPCNTEGTREVDTSYASAYGFLFAEGIFIDTGGEAKGVIRRDVPGPMPLLGLGAAFGYSRRLRKLLKNSRHK